MNGKSAAVETISADQSTEEPLREELYEQFGVSLKGRIAINIILPHLDSVVQTESRYDVDPRSKILAEISLWEAYNNEPKFKMFALATVLLGTYDYLHSFNPEFYGMTLIALATINGFVSSLRSPSMMTAELEGARDNDGMPADYRARALSSVNTNVTIVLFAIAIGVQFLVTSSYVQGEMVTQNVADGLWNPGITAFGLFLVPFILNRFRSSSDDD